MANEADIVVLCLPDDAAVEAVGRIVNPGTRVLDASSAHRVTEGWVYGLPELTGGHHEAIREAARVSNPGCYPTGFVLLVRPLVDAGVIPRDVDLVVTAVSGYSGGGRQRVQEYEGGSTSTPPFSRYSLRHEHKHVKEMRAFTLLDHAPQFLPSYAGYRQGIVMDVPLPRRLATPANVAAITDCYLEAYAHHPDIIVSDARAVHASIASSDSVVPTTHNGSNRIEVGVIFNEDLSQVGLMAVYDNLGKGASGAAMQNLHIMASADRYRNTTQSGRN